ncbi:MAG: hypothetical protein A4E57_02528 [Syntrophorhabdaceae bacterium PtaU1.Bin034]|jgi:hypothetical protein|nr:MAG: hypothetical protein A4E57_02528 [Syntrophorhabdaceae bacterium PtaU1.Bin034]
MMACRQSRHNLIILVPGGVAAISPFSIVLGIAPIVVPATGGFFVTAPEQ